MGRPMVWVMQFALYAKDHENARNHTDFECDCICFIADGPIISINETNIKVHFQNILLF